MLLIRYPIFLKDHCNNGLKIMDVWAKYVQFMLPFSANPRYPIILNFFETEKSHSIAGCVYCFLVFFKDPFDNIAINY